MAAVLHPATSGGVNFTAGANNFIPLGAGVTAAVNATETNVQTLFRAAGTFANLYARVVTNPRTSPSTCTFRKNGTSGSQTISIGSAATGEFQDSINTDVVAAGDKVDYLIVAGTGTAAQAWTIFSDSFTANTATVEKLLLASTVTISSSTTTSFYPLCGNLGISTSTQIESNVQYKTLTAGTFSNMFVNVPTNARTDITSYGLDINAVAGNLAISIGTLATGFFEDSSHTDVVGSGSLVNYYQIFGTATNSQIIKAIGVDYNNALSNSHLANIGAYTVNANLIRVLHIAGNATLFTLANEAQAQCKVQSTCTATNFGAFVQSNTVVGASTVNFRINGTSGNNALSIASLTSGFFSDTSHTDVLVPTSEINYLVTTGITGTSMLVSYFGIMLVSASGVVTIIPLLASLGVG